MGGGKKRKGGQICPTLPKQAKKAQYLGFQHNYNSFAPWEGERSDAKASDNVPALQQPAPIESKADEKLPGPLPLMGVETRPGSSREPDPWLDTSTTPAAAASSSGSQWQNMVRLYFCAHFFGPKEENVHLFSSSLPRFDKCHETSQIFPRTELTFASARSFGVIS